MRILHTSDLHGEIDRILGETTGASFDVVVDSGDFLPDCPGRREPGDDRERAFQTRFLDEIRARLRAWLGDRPMLYVPGNHDHVELDTVLAFARRVSLAPLTLEGLRIAGFPEVPWHRGVYQRALGAEVDDATLARRVATVFARAPTVLVTHTPPRGVLDAFPGQGPIGAVALAEALDRPHSVRWHLFGHVHASAGLTRRAGVTYSNASCSWRVLDIADDDPRVA